jgi:hypothetical protein
MEYSSSRGSGSGSKGLTLSNGHAGKDDRVIASLNNNLLSHNSYGQKKRSTAPGVSCPGGLAWQSVLRYMSSRQLL